MSLFSGWLEGASYREKTSGVLFPDEVGAFKRGPETKYEAEPGQGGVAIPYHAPGTEMTVYVRHVVDRKLTADAALADALAGIKELEARKIYADVKIYPFDASKAPAGWSVAAFTARMDGQFAVSFIYCKVRPGVLFKVRATTQSPAFENFQGEVELLLKAIDAVEKKA